MLAVDQIRKDDDLDFELDNYYDKDLDNDLDNDLEWLINTSVGQQKVGNQIPFWLRHVFNMAMLVVYQTIAKEKGIISMIILILIAGRGLDNDIDNDLDNDLDSDLDDVLDNLLEWSWW